MIFHSPVLAIVLLLVVVVIFLALVLSLSARGKAVLSREYKVPAGAELSAQEASMGFIEHINKGNELLGQYEFDKALGHFQEALKIKNNEPSVHFKIGRIFLQKEDYKNAIHAFRNVLNLNPNQLEAHFELARIFQIHANIEQAHQELNQALAINPDHEESLKLKVKLLEREEKYAQALPILKKLVAESRQPLKFRVQAADFLSKLGKYDESIMEYETLMEVDRDNRLHYQGRIGQAYFDKGNYPKAVECFKMILQDHGPTANEAAVGAIKTQMAAALCNEGVKYFEAEDYHSAIQRYREALMYDDGNPDIHYNLGKAYGRTKDALNAITHFEAAIALQPRDVSSYYELAVLQDEKGMISEALANYHKVLDLDPAHTTAAFGLGTLYGVQGEMDKAIRYLTETIRLRPDYVDAIYNLAVALERKKEFNKAAQMYKKVLSLDENHEKARSNLAHLKHMKHA